jgi:hypothetical protein
MSTAEYKRGVATGWRRSRIAALARASGRMAGRPVALGDSAGWSAIAVVALAIIVLGFEWVTLAEAMGG